MTEKTYIEARNKATREIEYRHRDKLEAARIERARQAIGEYLKTVKPQQHKAN